MQQQAQTLREETKKSTVQHGHRPILQFPSVELFTVPLKSSKNMLKCHLTTRGKGGTVFGHRGLGSPVFPVTDN